MQGPTTKQLTEQSRFVYDTRTGQIVHAHHMAAPAGTALPAAHKIDRCAIEEAARLTNRVPDTLGTLIFDRTSIKPGVSYSVHPVEKRLIEGGQPGRTPFVGAI